MDKNILKKFAIESRQDLMKKIEVKLKTFYVDEEFSKEQKNDIYVLTNEKHSLNLTDEQYKKRELLIKRIKELSLEQVIEEAAYTWFNRIIAIRYMELNDMLPLTKNNSSLGIRVLSSKDNKADPEIMKFTNLTNPDLDINFKKEQYAKLTEESKFEYVLLLVCKKLGQVIPQVFDRVTDYIDILILDNLLNDTGFVNKVVTEVPEDNFTQVEVIGWLYQYYNQTEKDRVISAKKTYMKTEIPYATQLFTPDWIVKYMVENSLGRYWVEHSNDFKIVENWKYFIKDNLDIKNEKINPQDISFIDPCCGSGHILVYAFEVLYKIYESVGFNKTDIPALILKNNIYGLDIDDRAGQLSILSILLKAREYDKNIFNKEVVINLNIMSLQESKNIMDFAVNNLPNTLKEKVNYLKDTFDNTKEIGSLLLVDNNEYSDVLTYINKEITIETTNLQEYIPNLIKQANILSKKYDIVVTNPPYMNNSVMTNLLKQYLEKKYNEVKTDMFSSFIMRNSKFGKDNAYLGYMTPYVWMFIGSYEKLRKYIINNMRITSLIQLEYSALEEATVPICTFILRNTEFDGVSNSKGTFYDLSEFTGGMLIQEKKFLEALLGNYQYRYIREKSKFSCMKGTQIAYQNNDKMFDIFETSKKISDYSAPKCGLKTGITEKYVKRWQEINYNSIGFNIYDRDSSIISNKKWFPASNGGEYRKWFGNNYDVVYWFNDGYEIRHLYNENGKLKSRPQNMQYYFKQGLTWSAITSKKLSIRVTEKGNIITGAGYGLFNDNNNLFSIMALLNSKVIEKLIKSISQTLNFEVGVLEVLPVKIEKNEEIDEIVSENIKISKEDWNSFESSWDFKKHPLVNMGISLFDLETKQREELLENNYNYWANICIESFNILKHNEEVLNKIFIDIYGLQDELTPNVEDKDITVRKADKVRDIKSLISYAVGCMFGRYSLDEDGLIYAGGEFDSLKYKTFKVDNDNVIPITDDSYFADDIVSRFKNFIEIVYGRGTLSENMDFIAETLGKRGTETSEATIRRYFNNDFYKDHIKTYQKRPIYWLFDSGKKNGFKCLVYMHRYNDGLVAKVRLDYLHRIQTTYERLLNDVSSRLSNEDLDINTKKELQKQQIDLSSKLQETLEYDEKIANVANQRINIDLDDGVTVNYSKFVYINPKTSKEESILGQIK
ncbi:MAG: BREX-1 system adenine-specific DNA-methyltransferase PglX [Bacilli bacterium]